MVARRARARACVCVCVCVCYMRTFTNCFPFVTKPLRADSRKQSCVSVKDFGVLLVVRSCVHYTLNPNITLESCDGLAVLNRQGVIPSRLMNGKGGGVPHKKIKEGVKVPP